MGESDRGKPADAGPPERVDIPGQNVERAFEGTALDPSTPGRGGPPRFAARFDRGGKAVDEDFADIHDRGSGTVELHYPNGHYVTVDAESQLKRIGPPEHDG